MDRCIRKRPIRSGRCGCARMVDERLRHRVYTRAVGDDPPDVRNWILAHLRRERSGQAAISRNGAHT